MMRLASSPGPIRLRAATGALMGVLLASGCSADTPRTSAEPDVDDGEGIVRDDRGEPVRVVGEMGRVVSLVPALTEVVIALGGADQIVGRTRFDHDTRIAHAPSLGGAVDPDVEAVLGRRPDLVLTWEDVDARAVTERLESLGVPVYATRIRSIADFDRHVRTLGTLLDREEQGDALLQRIHSGFDAVRADVAEGDRPSVLFVAWPRPLLTTGGGTFVDDLIRIVGGRGTFHDLSEPWPTVSLESALERRPDLVVIASERAERGAVWIERDPLWRSLQAVRRGRVYVVDADRFIRPGPHMADAAVELARYVRAAGEPR